MIIISAWARVLRRFVGYFRAHSRSFFGRRIEAAAHSIVRRAQIAFIFLFFPKFLSARLAESCNLCCAWSTSQLSNFYVVLAGSRIKIWLSLPLGTHRGSLARWLDLRVLPWAWPSRRLCNHVIKLSRALRDGEIGASSRSSSARTGEQGARVTHRAVVARSGRLLSALFHVAVAIVVGSLRRDQDLPSAALGLRVSWLVVARARHILNLVFLRCCAKHCTRLVLKTLSRGRSWANEARFGDFRLALDRQGFLLHFSS
mmetsp:Transcript_14603/g.19763  ORF Transcript_14603/g.19763 Transcript_14603/m.19763 type:complete len:258 (+) Transcript_14603:801-1574(+)